jgi:hypothetical protein
MKTELQPGEVVLRTGPANLFRGWEAAGGHLTLTNQRLVFEAHRFNLKSYSTLIELSAVTGLELCWTKLFNLIPLVPNALAVQTAGAEFRFVLHEREAWRRAIDEARGAQ